jgi:SAM-dependent methyltransferase
MISESHYFRDTCRMCDSRFLTKTLSLTPTPPGNDFLTKQELGRNEPKYPLDLYFCENCSHLQLGHVVNPKILYQKNYTYVSGTSSNFVNHLKKYSRDMIKKFELNSNDLVVDIGSNDGTCLSFFKNSGMKVVGVDPAKEIAVNATNAGIETIGDFFSYELSISLRKKFGPAKFITSHNACAHIDNLMDIIKGVKNWLDEDGIFVLEVGYLADVYANTWFDTIYHEHLDFHSVAPFEHLFERAGLELISVQRIAPQGGSIRLMSQIKGAKFKRDNSVEELISIEKKLGINKSKTFLEFDNKISLVRDKLKHLLNELKKQGKSIAGFGAPTKATTLMAHFNLNENVLDFIVDDNPLKQGLFTPISHIPIVSSDELYKLKPDYVLILAWNFANPIIEAHKEYSIDIGKFIIPMPIPHIVE